MNKMTERLVSLIEFAKQSALLRSNPVKSLDKHGIFCEHEHKLKNMPGIRLDQANDDDNAWLVVERLQKLSPPQPKSELLKVWLDLTNNPNTEPKLFSQVSAKTLISFGLLASDSDKIDDKQPITLQEFSFKDKLEKLFKAYTETEWKPWAKQEKIRRLSIQLYAKLFDLKQHLEGNIADKQLELVWGIGMAIWEMNGSKICYPLITQLVELSIDDSSMAIKIRPRNIEPRFELDIFADADNPGVSILEKTSKEFFSQSGIAISPFEQETFSPLLKSAATHLDGNGVYWPEHSEYSGCSLPSTDDRLKVTDTWALFARPRGANLFIQDLERFKNKIENTELNLPSALAALVTEPKEVHEDVEPVSFRGTSIGNSCDYESTPKAKDLFFPLPFNEEQVRIAQLLEHHDGVVVQGPPGTGKTHTIANIISHYLALGKRVLVTSMKEPALSVLQEKLPQAIQPLAIALLTSEAEGTKQFEFAISKIASEVQRIDRNLLAKEISNLESDLDILHAKLAKIDRRISEWAFKNLSKIDLDGEKIEPLEVAKEVIANLNDVSWIEDDISESSKFCPKFSYTDINELKQARKKIGKHLHYLESKLPSAKAFPSIQDIIEAHKNLCSSYKINLQIESGELPELVNSSQETIEQAQLLSSRLTDLRLLRESIQDGHSSWIETMLKRLRKGADNELLGIFELLDTEITQAITERKKFITRPVSAPENIDSNEEIIEAIKNLCQAKKPFGLVGGIVGKKEAKLAINEIRIVNERPNKPEEWEHVLDYVTKLKHSRGLLTRWNTLAQELSLPIFDIDDPIKAISFASNILGKYKQLKLQVALEIEVYEKIKSLLPWKVDISRNLDDSTVDNIERILSLHLNKYQLDKSLNVRESCIHGLLDCNGSITSEIKDFFVKKLGNPSTPEDDLRAQWAALMEELSCLNQLEPHFYILKSITSLICDSGASKWAEKLKTIPVNLDNDNLLPDNWTQLWRLKRLHSAIRSLDARVELKQLAKQRNEAEEHLSTTYQTIVAKRTWLQLAINATPTVRGALIGYSAAISKMGKGTGKRAYRYRLNARNDAKRASSAIPCWIMPHYRVSESLPDELGYFDLVIIDEASQSDLTALPALFRAKKILVVGDQKQVSPDAVGMDVQKVENLISRFLLDQVDLYRAQMTPENSIYDLFRVVFASSMVMLKEHFRCVPAIIEYSKREFYRDELKPLRLPRASERLDPPLIDVLVEDGFRAHNDTDSNPAEAKFIVDEIKAIIENPTMATKTIGVVSLTGNTQAQKIYDAIHRDLGQDVIHRHNIACGDARTFQGKERDIMFLSMIITPDSAHAISGTRYDQRFNVAASRARDRMYLVRSVTLDNLSQADYLRRSLISHFSAPFNQDELKVKSLRELCESEFEREIYDILTERGYCVTPQVKVSEFRIDMVVEGDNDARLAIECDGDRYHGPERWEDDIRRQRILERAGWKFWRCFASTFVMHRQEVIEDLLLTLSDHDIEPLGVEGYRSPLTEFRRYTAFSDKEDPAKEVMIEELANVE